MVPDDLFANILARGFPNEVDEILQLLRPLFHRHREAYANHGQIDAVAGIR